MIKESINFSIDFVQYLDDSGNPSSTLPGCAKEVQLLLSCYRQMVLTRLFDAKAVTLQRTGKLGTFPSSLGQEAVFVAIGKAMRPEDIYAPYYRDQGVLFQRGVRPSDVLTYWGGDERGSNTPAQGHDFPIAVPIASQCLHAVGAGYAIKLKAEKRVVVTTVGDGGTSEGAFYEAMNFAAIHQLPIIFIVNNNQWAISVPSPLQTHATTFAQKAIAAGIDSIQVDGNDFIAIYEQTLHAVDYARSNKGPFLIEAKTYRLCDHTTADDAKRYVPKEELDKAWKAEPIKRLQTYLISRNIMTKTEAIEIEENCRKEIEAEVKVYEAMPKAKPAAMFDYLYEQLPKTLQEQYQELVELGKSTNEK